ncbi:MAG: molybdopterin-dependent oxidoreductase [Chloroflexi bacterium]|nr:molybdopterin-dependent oxidoreductase [Chloroflexota bacterium]
MTASMERLAGSALSLRSAREGIRPPKFADKFAQLDFAGDPMPVISMFSPPEPGAAASKAVGVRGEDLRDRVLGCEELSSLPVRVLEAPLVCQIFNWHEQVEWTGVRVSDVIAAFGPETHPEGYYAFRSHDGHYFETLSRDEARDPRVLIAFGMNGAPLPHQYGGPFRLVVPFLQGYKSVKWLARIEAFRHDPAGIKRLLGQSKTARLGQAWVDRLNIEPAAGRPGDPI